MSSEIPCVNCKVFKKTKNLPDRTIVCEGARVCGECFIIEKLNQIREIVLSIPKPRTWYEEDPEDSSRDVRMDNFEEVNNALRRLEAALK